MNASSPAIVSQSAGPASSASVFLKVLLKLIAAYMGTCVLGLLVRAELTRWGWPIYDNGHPVLRRALVLHGLGVVAALIALRVTRRTHPSADVPLASNPQSIGSPERLWCRLLLAASPFLLLLSADLILSVPFPPPPYGERSVFMRDPKLIWRLQPGAKGTRGMFPVEINAQGLRGPLVPYERAADEYRILFLGDSTTLGYGQPWEATFVARTQSLLPSLRGKRVTVINAGIDGYTTWQEFGFLTDEGVRYTPDIVVLGFCLNDLTDYEWPFVVYAGGRWLKHSGIFRALQFWRHGLRRDWVSGRKRDFAPPLLDEVFQERHSQAAQKGWREALGDVDQMRSYCAGADIEFVLLFIPAQAQVLDPTRYDDYPQRKLAAFAAERGIAFLDPFPTMRERGPDLARRCFMDNWHFSAEGHAVVAELIAAHLESRR